ncbi:AMP-binding protein [Haloechinothrix sp. YIM 98757]|uniref:AMP-binding protein n=1 Tax=Haloechinothrix aidingensis TaxID=2752311 RepID=A0A837ZYN9_9PSEU|nr:AMP-binding protein [Haloechinothrix aidingensis]MBA0125324.1 AMP-binding protein [Haloechinothrix aidingensis]
MSETRVRPTSSGIVPWPAGAVARYEARGYWEGRSFGAHLAEAARASPEATCLVDGERRMTYRELLARADGAAVRMNELGLRADDRLVVRLPNCWEFVVVTVACFRAGIVPVWTLMEHGRHELAAIAAHAEARALVVPDVHKGIEQQELAREVVGDVPSLEHVFVKGSDTAPGSIDLGALCEPAADGGASSTDLDMAAPGGDAVATLLLSGGTTGTPKLIARTGNDLAYMIRRVAELCEFGPDTTYLAVLPVGHGFVNTGPGILGTLLAGGRVVLAGSPAPEVALPAIERERVTVTSAVPAVVQRWLDSHDEDPCHDLSSLRLLQVGASRLDPAVASRIGPGIGCTLQQVFGMGEGLLCLTRPDDPADVINHTQGRPISPDDEIRIVDDDGLPVPPGEPGALLTRGPYTIRGYYRSTDLDARAFVGDGWYRTGDIVRQTPEGNLIVAGREKDVINRGGEKISAEEIEAFACRVDGVRHAAAVAMPHEELGEAVCLFVVAEPGKRVRLDDVHAVLSAAGAARFKFPERLVLVPSLPLTGVGKVDKKALRAAIGAGRYDSSSILASR